MSYNNYYKIFQCPSCGSIGEIYLLKVDGAQIIVKQKCPSHGGRSFKVPLRDLVHYYDPIRDGIFRCYECGRRANPGLVKFSGSYAVFNCVCQNPGHSKKTQKIWSTIYIEILQRLKKQQPEKTPEKTEISQKKQETIDNKKKEQFCPNCGTKLDGTEKFCGICGIKL